MWLHTSCLLEFEPAEHTPFIFMLRPRSGWQQWVGREQYLISPSVPVVEFTDPFGNLCQRLVAPPGPFSMSISADILSADESDVTPGAPFIEIQDLPEGILPFLLPSRYCESDCFTQMASEIVAGQAPGYDQCFAIVEYIRRSLRYAPGTCDQNLSACQVNEKTGAVCRDMAHLGIALCRALAIPTRMVVGYLADLEPMDMHAWFEAYVGNRWYTFDPTQEHVHGGRVAVAYGRDAADVAIYTQFGEPVPLLRMDVNVEKLAHAPE